MINLDNVYVADIETDGLLDEMTKLHVMSICWKNKDGKWEIISTNKEEDTGLHNYFSDKMNSLVGMYKNKFNNIVVKSPKD